MCGQGGTANRRRRIGRARSAYASWLDEEPKAVWRTHSCCTVCSTVYVLHTLKRQPIGTCCHTHPSRSRNKQAARVGDRVLVGTANQIFPRKRLHAHSTRTRGDWFVNSYSTSHGLHFQYRKWITVTKLQLCELPHTIPMIVHLIQPAPALVAACALRYPLHQHRKQHLAHLDTAQWIGMNHVPDSSSGAASDVHEDEACAVFFATYLRVPPYGASRVYPVGMNHITVADKAQPAVQTHN